MVMWSMIQYTFDPFWPTSVHLVHCGPIWSTSVHLIHFSPVWSIRSILSTSINLVHFNPFNPFNPLWYISIHLGPIQSTSIHSVLNWSTSFSAVHVGLFWSISVYFGQFGPLQSISMHQIGKYKFGLRVSILNMNLLKNIN